MHSDVIGKDLELQRKLW